MVLNVWWFPSCTVHPVYFLVSLFTRTEPKFILQG